MQYARDAVGAAAAANSLLRAAAAAAAWRAKSFTPEIRPAARGRRAAATLGRGEG